MEHALLVEQASGGQVEHAPLVEQACEAGWWSMLHW